MIYLVNAFSAQMLSPDLFKEDNDIVIVPNVIPEIPADVEFKSAIGHPDLAAFLSSFLGRTVEFCRDSISVKPGDVLYIAQLTGGRLPEGTTTLPEGFKLTFWRYDILRTEDFARLL